MQHFRSMAARPSWGLKQGIARQQDLLEVVLDLLRDLRTRRSPACVALHKVSR